LKSDLEEHVSFPSTRYFHFSPTSEELDSAHHIVPRSPCPWIYLPTKIDWFLWKLTKPIWFGFVGSLKTDRLIFFNLRNFEKNPKKAKVYLKTFGQNQI
jgi:hypothetical protein